jgi:hypothetical protein
LLPAVAIRNRRTRASAIATAATSAVASAASAIAITARATARPACAALRIIAVAAAFIAAAAEFFAPVKSVLVTAATTAAYRRAKRSSQRKNCVPHDRLNSFSAYVRCDIAGCVGGKISTLADAPTLARRRYASVKSSQTLGFSQRTRKVAQPTPAFC